MYEFCILSLMLNKIANTICMHIRNFATFNTFLHGRTKYGYLFHLTWFSDDMELIPHFTIENVYFLHGFRKNVSTV